MADLSASSARLLTPRQAQILDLICAGATYRQVGHILHISPNTVKARCRQAYARLGARNTDAAAAAWGKSKPAWSAARQRQAEEARSRRICPDCGEQKGTTAQRCRRCTDARRRGGRP
jgi:DNA-binding CsgD family transcriptional regulator